MDILVKVSLESQSKPKFLAQSRNDFMNFETSVNRNN